MAARDGTVDWRTYNACLSRSTGPQSGPRPLIPHPCHLPCRGLNPICAMYIMQINGIKAGHTFTDTTYIIWTHSSITCSCGQAPIRSLWSWAWTAPTYRCGCRAPGRAHATAATGTGIRRCAWAIPTVCTVTRMYGIGVKRQDQHITSAYIGATERPG